MPVQRCSKGGKPGYKYGPEGTCYVYDSGDENGRKLAREKAERQGRAIEISRHGKGDRDRRREHRS